MNSRPDIFTDESLAKAAAFEAILNGASSITGGVLSLSDDDVRCCVVDQWRRRNCHILRALKRALRNAWIKPNTHIQFTGNASALSFDEIQALEQYVMKHGVPHGMKISIIVSADTHPAIKRKAAMLDRMFAQNDPLAHLMAYLDDPQPNTNLYVTHEMRKLYQHGLEPEDNLINDLIKLIDSGKMTSFTKIHFEDCVLANANEAKRIIRAVRQCKRIPEKFEIFISERCGEPRPARNNPADIVALQAELYDLFVDAGKQHVQDNEVAFAAFMASGVFDSKFSDDGVLKVFTEKAVAERIFTHVNPKHDNPYAKAATLQHDKVHERAQQERARRYWGFFKIGAAAVAVGVATVGVVALTRNAK